MVAEWASRKLPVKLGVNCEEEKEVGCDPNPRAGCRTSTQPQGSTSSWYRGRHSSAIADHNRGEPGRRPSGLALAMSSTSGAIGVLLRAREGRARDEYEVRRAGTDFCLSIPMSKSMIWCLMEWLLQRIVVESKWSMTTQ